MEMLRNIHDRVKRVLRRLMPVRFRYKIQLGNRAVIEHSREVFYDGGLGQVTSMMQFQQTFDRR